MNRRSFFATLFAPVVAMALPKPKYDPYRLGTWHGNKFTPDMPETFASHGHKIGEAIHVRKPMRFVSSQGRIDVLYGWDAIKHENVIIRL